MVQKERDIWTIQAKSPSGAYFRHKLDLGPMTKLVAQSLIENGYLDVSITTHTGQRFDRDDILRPDFEL